MQRKWTSLAAVVLLAAAAAPAAKDEAKAAWKRWWSDVKYLASDKLQGRMTGSPAYLKAAQYVAKRFAAEDLKPAGEEGYFQPVKFESLEVDEANSSMELVEAGTARPLTLGKEVILSATGDSAKEINAEAVFVGYGISAPEVNYEDLAGLDLRGKIAVYLAGGPSTIKDPLRAHKESGAERWKAMKDAGAIGAAVIFNPAEQEIPWDRIANNRKKPSLQLADGALRRDPGKEISFAINPANVDEFLAGSGHTMEEIIAAAKAHQPLPHFPLKVRIQATIYVNRSEAESPNVVAEIEGSDPELKNEFVIVSAHLDHLGVGQPVKGDSIYHGAMDNASGVAALIEIAHQFRASQTLPNRSVIFLAICGEEEGELGSWYFANHPTVPAQNIVADINMDMFLPLFPLEYLQVQGLDESTLGDDIRAVGRAEGVQVIEDEQPEANRFIRSDQYSFVQRGVPALAFKFGYVKGSSQEKIFNDWVHTRYHSPLDNLSQPVDKEAAAKLSHLLYLLADRVADEPARPAWEPASFFRRFASSSGQYQ